MSHSDDPCIGWPADPPCPVYGQFHGCQRPDGHRERFHICPCGGASRSEHGLTNRGALNVCGTQAGYRRHTRAGEIACIPCRAAHAAHERGRAWMRRTA